MASLHPPPPVPGRLRRLALAGLAALALAATGCAVTPSREFQHSSFEGFDVISYVPEQPRGLVYLFHGSNGSAAFAERVESTDVLNRLIGQGYGFVSTSSTERTGDRRWEVASSVHHREPRPRAPRPPAHPSREHHAGRPPPRRWWGSACRTAPAS